MAKRPSIYRRLTRRKRRLLGYSQLWMAPDHILLVKSLRFTEQYQHFALADIQAIAVTELPDRTVLRVGAGVAAILWTLLVLTVNSRFSQGFFLITGAVAIGMVILDFARGTRCRCHLYTAVTRELLTPVTRVSAARKFLAQVRPEIEAVQGVLAPEQTLANAHPPTPVDQPPAMPWKSGYLPEVLFGLFLFDAAIILLGYRFERADTTVLITTLLGELVLMLVTLIRGAIAGPRDPRRIIYLLIVATILCFGWDAVGLARVVGQWFVMITSAAQRGTPPGLPTGLFPRNAAFFAAGWRIAAGVIGLIAARFKI